MKFKKAMAKKIKDRKGPRRHGRPWSVLGLRIAVYNISWILTFNNIHGLKGNECGPSNDGSVSCASSTQSQSSGRVSRGSIKSCTANDSARGNGLSPESDDVIYMRKICQTGGGM